VGRRFDPDRAHLTQDFFIRRVVECRYSPKVNDLPFNGYAKNINSQNGEDGIICEVLNRLMLKNSDSSWCVEVGAWDGIHLSNTFALVEQGWKAVYIEGDSYRFQDLLKTAHKFSNIIPIEAIVSQYRDNPFSLENLLSGTKIPKDFVLLSIDIDSYDLDVWESLSGYFPQIVVIEINSSVNPGVYWRHGANNVGNTFSSTIKVGTDKGYTLICHTGNLIFVKNELISKLDFPTKFIKYPELLFVDNWINSKLYNRQSKIRFRGFILSLIPMSILPLAIKLRDIREKFKSG